MFKKKIITIAGASVVTVSLLAGVTYAWFTYTQTQEIATDITAGTLGIAFNPITSDEESLPLYPQLTLIDEESGKEYPDETGNITDVVTYSFTLANQSDRQVLVRINGVDLIASVMGSALDEKGNVIEEADPVLLTEADAVKISYDYENEDEVYLKDNNAYIFLPTGTSSKDITFKVWIDGDTYNVIDGVSDANKYQNATIDVNNLTATAVQYRKAAIEATFTELIGDDLSEIEKFGEFE